MVRPLCVPSVPRNSAFFRLAILSGEFRRTVKIPARAGKLGCRGQTSAGGLDRPGPGVRMKSRVVLRRQLPPPRVARRLHHGQQRIPSCPAGEGTLESDPAYDYAEDTPSSDDAETEEEELSKRPSGSFPGRTGRFRGEDTGGARGRGRIPWRTGEENERCRTVWTVNRVRLTFDGGAAQGEAPPSNVDSVSATPSGYRR